MQQLVRPLPWFGLPTLTCSWLLNSMAITSSVLLAAPACRREYVEDKAEDDDEDMAFASAPHTDCPWASEGEPFLQHHGDRSIQMGARTTCTNPPLGLPLCATYRSLSLDHPYEEQLLVWVVEAEDLYSCLRSSTQHRLDPLESCMHTHTKRSSAAVKTVIGQQK